MAAEPKGIFIDSDPINLAEVEKNGKVALITGITGQDGSYLAELLLQKVCCAARPVKSSSSPNARIYVGLHCAWNYSPRIDFQHCPH